uniref:Serpin B4-like n=1 Tax=Canis lupus dingo TaxID=286419 RepID=A0A8C0KW61_CANLU
MNSLSAANTRFAFDLFQQFKTSKKGDNIFFSPLSISSALAMTYLGAKENTALEIGKVEKMENVHHQFQKLLTELKKPTDAYELNMANKFYGEKKYQFLQTNHLYFHRRPLSFFFPFAEKIKDMFPKDSLNHTILVLVNAVYFKGQWDTKFDTKNTVEKEFCKPVQMMRQSNVFNFTSLEDLQAKILEIPYKGKDLSMMLLLPHEVDGLQKLEDQLTAEKLIEWTSSQNMSNGQVDLYLPRFKVEESYELKATLKALGMVDAFNTKSANFSGMTGRQDLVVSKVRHKSFVEVTEEGTEAAASTDVEVIAKSAPIYPFHCDHPFLFFIKHNKTNSILFLGRVSSP